MRRTSLTPLMSQGSMEPVIVVEEPGIIFEEIERSDGMSPQQSLDIDSPMLNPYLLSPWRDHREVRKHSLPTPQCSGITASQVRRLSDRGGDGPSPREAEFLATLSQGPVPSIGGRRHSVVTISKVPTTLFGHSRRESIAAYPAGGVPGRILGSRRESMSGAAGPPSIEHRGSIHNLQLDIMDDIVTARKVRMKMWNTSNEKVCEVQPLDEVGIGAAASSTQRYTQPSAIRRYSDFVSTQLTAIPSTKRRASELPPPAPTSSSKENSSLLKPRGAAGIVCSNTDLICILSNLTSSATEINQITNANDQKPASLDQKRNRLKSKRSNSFDVSILHGTELMNQQSSNSSQPGPSNWFVKRHQPMSTKKDNQEQRQGQTKKQSTITLAKEKIPTVTKCKEQKVIKENSKDSKNKVVWDGRSGSLVDAEVLGSAIEVFLRRSGAPENTPSSASSTTSPSKGAIPKTANKSSGKSRSGSMSSGWYSNKDNNDDDKTESCDTSSLCSTLKDLFVK